MYVLVIYFFAILLVIKLVASMTTVRCKSKVCMVGKTALVTGGNSGIGLELVKSLAERGCRVIIVDRVNAKQTVDLVIKETHNPHISYKVADLSKMDEVRRLDKELNEELDSLHVLINNAGLADLTNGELVFTVNYLSHFLLTHLLTELLIKSASSRILFTSSIASYGSPFKENFDTVELYDPVKSYQYSKLSLALASNLFAEKLKGFGVTSNCYHPGLVKTNIWLASKWNGRPKSYLHLLYIFLAICTSLFGKTAEEGMQTAFYLAIADEVKNVTGKFFMECIPCYQPRKVHDKKFRQKFWEFSEKAVNLKDEEKLEAVLKTQIRKQ